MDTSAMLQRYTKVSGSWVAAGFDVTLCPTSSSDVQAYMGFFSAITEWTLIFVAVFASLKTTAGGYYMLTE